MHKHILRTLAASTALIGVVTVTGCAGSPIPGSPSASTASSAPGPTSASPAGRHNGQDVMFAQMMIPHHQQAIMMSDLILAKQGIDPRVSELARQIKAAQAPEITTMRGWLAGWGADPSPSAMGHDGMNHDGMGDGMMSSAQLSKLRKADGKQASRLFLTGMTAHHRGAIAMAETETSMGADPAARKLAVGIISGQQAEINTMKKLLTDL